MKVIYPFFMVALVIILSAVDAISDKQGPESGGTLFTDSKSTKAQS